ncbi:InlB B-repeat-containing protein [Clostridium taeniosporum]|uniref:Cell wall-binding protein n=1 Tax=Clostridium taeniosporum TaxID=394958 RepID=A0A1D7XMK4_9CLOT|nr:InlB B-repeat-containing protein [Clostridium taeniosporum]AOR24562.1 cell wall-binding protein [Clostridium taeniosporum]
MKNVLLRKVLASVLTATIVITFIPIKASASWKKDYLGNWNWTENGQKSIGWKNINGDWYYFDYSGIMRTGWINDWGYWYYADSNGIIQTGIIEIDEKIYAFDDKGIMQTGNISINGKSYKFSNKGYAIGDSIPTPMKTFDKANNLLPYGSKPPYAISNNSSDNFKSDDEIFKDVKTIKVRYKVKFDTDGGSKVSPITNIKSGKTIDLPDEPKKDGYKFDGWYKDDDFDREFTEDTRIRSNMKVYAKWIKEDSSGNSNSGNSSFSNSHSVIVNNIQITVGESESDLGNVKVSAKAKNYEGIIDTTIDLIDKETNKVKKTQTLNIGGSGHIRFTFTGIEKGTYYAKVTVGKVSVNSSEFTVLSKDELSNNDVIKDMNELRLENLSLVIDDLNLPIKGSHGSTITWKSSNSNIIKIPENYNTEDSSILAKLNRSINDTGVEKVVLTATVSKGNSKSVTKEFNAYVKNFDENLGEAVESINNALKLGNSEDDKILSIKNQLTTNHMVNIGVSNSQYDKYNDLNISSKPDEEQIYQLEVAKAVYKELKSNSEISSNHNDEPNLYRKELENAAVGIVRVFNNAVMEQAKLKKENEDFNSRKQELEAKRKALKELIDKCQGEENSGILNSDKYTSISWKAYKDAIEYAKNTTMSNSITTIDSAINTLNKAYKGLEKASLVKITLYKDGDNIWSDFNGEVSLKKGNYDPVVTDFAIDGARKAAVTEGDYKILVNGIDTGKVVSVTDKLENDKPIVAKLYYYTVSFSIVGSDSINGEIISAKYDGQDIKSGDVLLGGNELVIRVKGVSDNTNSFEYSWKDNNGKELSKISTYGTEKLENKVDVKCEIKPIDVFIDNLITTPDELGNISVKSRVINGNGSNVKIELLDFSENQIDVMDNVQVNSGYAEVTFRNVSTGLYKVKITVNGIEKISNAISIKNVDPNLKKAIDEINLAITNNNFNDIKTVLENNKDYFKFNFDDYSKLNNDNYKIEVAKAIYNSGKTNSFTVDDLGKSKIQKAFNDAVNVQLSLQEFENQKEKLIEAINDEYIDGENRKTLKLIADKDTYESTIWNKYESAIKDAIKIENASKPNSTNSNVNAIINNINNAVKTLEDAKASLSNAKLREVKIEIYENGKMKSGISNVKLQGTVSKHATEISDGFKVYVPDGTYKVTINGYDIGETIDVNSLVTSKIINYYTVKYNVIKSPSIRASIIATYDGKSISNGSSIIAKPGKELLFKVTASSNDKEEIIYSWKNSNDTNVASKTDFKYAINSISTPIDVICEVKHSESSVIETIKSYVMNNKVNLLTISKLEEVGLTGVVKTNLDSYKKEISKLTTDNINKTSLQEIIKQVNTISTSTIS